jgi:hypothetical protein
LKARAKVRAEYPKQGICTDLFYDDFVADCQCQHCKQYRADVLRFNSVNFAGEFYRHIRRNERTEF